MLSKKSFNSHVMVDLLLQLFQLKHQSMVAQMAERVATDSRVRGLNPARNPMERASTNASVENEFNNNYGSRLQGIVHN